MPSLNNNNNNNLKTKLRLRSNKNNIFYNSPSSIFDFIKMSKLKRTNNNYNCNNFNINDIQQPEQHEIKNNIQNVNININNQINIGINNFKDIISRNENRNKEFKTITQNKVNYNRPFHNMKRKNNNNNIFQKNKLSTINLKKFLGRNKKKNSK
jgi:hypothetical protein